MTPSESILITGASSGLGAALSECLAGANSHLFLLGRNEARLRDVAQRCQALGAIVRYFSCDVTDRGEMAKVIAACDTIRPICLLIANAGVSAGTGGGTETADQARRIFAVNLDGVLNTIDPILPSMRSRRRGQIALISSLASFVSMPGAPAYCASKAAVRVYGEALRGALARDGIDVSIVCPGFVRTPMTDVNDFPMPMLMEADVAARRIASGLRRRQGRVAFPWPLYAAVRLTGCLPYRVVAPFLRRLPSKPTTESP